MSEPTEIMLPEALLNVLALHERTEQADVDFLFDMLDGVADDKARRAIVAGFRRQIWQVAAQEGYEAASA